MRRMLAQRRSWARRPGRRPSGRRGRSPRLLYCHEAEVIVELDDQGHGQPQRGDVGVEVRILAVRVGLRTVKVLVSQLRPVAVSYTHLRAHETDSYLVCRL